MKRKSKIFYTIFTICFFAMQNATGEGIFTNNLKSVNFDRNKSGKPEIILTLDKMDDVRVIKKDDLEYVILLPETSSFGLKKPSLEPVSDLVNDVEIKTQAYTGNIKGYTKITIKTIRPVAIGAKASLDMPAPPKKELIEKAKLQEQKRIERERIKAEQKAKKEQLARQKQEQLQKLEEQKKIQQEQKKKLEEQKKVQQKQNKKLEEQKKVQQKQTQTKKEIKPNEPKNVVAPKTQVKETKPVQEQPKVAEQPKTVEIQPVEQTPVSEQVPAIEQSSEEPSISNEETKELTQTEKQDKARNNLLTRSLITSLGITGILLILLFILKKLNKYNRTYAKIMPNKNLANETTEEIPSENISAETTPQQEKIVFDDISLPVHEVYEHKQDDVLNEEPVMEENSVQEEIQTEDLPLQSDEINIAENNINPEPVISETVLPETVVTENIEETVTPVNEVQPLENINENVQNNSEILPQNPVYEEPAFEQDLMQAQNNYEEKIEFEKREETPQHSPIDPIKIEELDEIYNNYNSKATPDEVFGSFEDELDTIRNEVKDTKPEKNDIKESVVKDNFIKTQEEKEVNEDITEEKAVVLPKTNSFEFLEELYDDIEEDTIEDVDYNTNNEEQEEISEENEQEDDYSEVIKGSYDFTPTKSLYLVDYEGSSILMASIKDKFVILKKFDYLVDKPLLVRQTEKTKKKASYIVRVGIFRCVIEVTMKNVEMVLEL